MEVPTDLKYSQGHTWARVEGDIATIGVSDYAQSQLGPVLFVEVSEVGDRVTQDEPCGAAESDKATSDIMAPVSGEVIETNRLALDAPEFLNDDPYGMGWLLKVRLSDPAELGKLMDAAAFEAYCQSEG